MECYYFFPQCKDNFKIARAKDYKHVSFAAFFLKDRIFFASNSTKTRLNAIELHRQVRKSVKLSSKKV